LARFPTLLLNLHTIALWLWIQQSDTRTRSRNTSSWVAVLSGEKSHTIRRYRQGKATPVYLPPPQGSSCPCISSMPSPRSIVGLILATSRAYKEYPGKLGPRFTWPFSNFGVNRGLVALSTPIIRQGLGRIAASRRENDCRRSSLFI